MQLVENNQQSTSFWGMVGSLRDLGLGPLCFHILVFLKLQLGTNNCPNDIGGQAS